MSLEFYSYFRKVISMIQSTLLTSLRNKMATIIVFKRVFFIAGQFLGGMYEPPALKCHKRQLKLAKPVFGICLHKSQTAHYHCVRLLKRWKIILMWALQAFGNILFSWGFKTRMSCFFVKIIKCSSISPRKVITDFFSMLWQN